MRTVQLNDGRIVPALAYYNEFDSNAADWLENLIRAGLIAPGIVDRRSLLEVRPEDLDGFVQCHFFAGIGIWSYGLRRAGWPDDRPVWTGSCPCQPFSAAGKQKGFDDERHLWPIWFRNLIAQCGPAVVAGEQVASALDWLDLVQNDMEGAGYAFGSSDLCAAGFAMEGWRETGPAEWLRRAIHDCPDPVVAGMLRDFATWADANLGGHDGDHIRQRLYWVGIRTAGLADASDCDRVDHHHDQGSQGHAGHGDGRPGRAVPVGPVAPTGGPGRLADTDKQGSSGRGICRPGEGDQAGLRATCERSAGLRADGRLGDTRIESCQRDPGAVSGTQAPGDRARVVDGCVCLGYPDAGDACGLADAECFGREVAVFNHGSSGAPPAVRQANQSGMCQSDGRTTTDAPLLGRNPADWLFCRDGKWRPVGSGTFPLVDAPPARVGRLRAYGNALDGETVATFCAVVLEIVSAGESPETSLALEPAGVTIEDHELA